MSDKKKFKVFISHNYNDKAKVELLKAQLTAKESNIDIAWVEQSPSLSQNLQTAIDNQVSASTMLLMLVGERWSKWQELELKIALEKNIPVAGIISPGSRVANNPLFRPEQIPFVNWNWEDIANLLSGVSRTIDYQLANEHLNESPIIQLDFSQISEQLTQLFLSNPNALNELSPRKFEELVAYLMEKHGYEVTLTQQSRDGGIDIFALKRDIFGSFLTIVDCKKYSASNPIGVGLVRTMYGTLNVENASHGMIATTSRFTKDAKDLAEEYKYQLSLKDHADIIKWIESTKSNNAN